VGRTALFGLRLLIALFRASATALASWSEWIEQRQFVD
jgi:hypothetical protein